MSCSRNNQNDLRNLDTTVYRRQSSCCDDNSQVTIQFVDRPVPYCPYPPMPPFPPTPTPPTPPTPPAVDYPTASFAQFANTADTGATFEVGTNVPFASTIYNTDLSGITNSNGIITLSGGTSGRAYLVSYQINATFTDATIAIDINGVINNNTLTAATGETTISGSYIVEVPANTTSTVQLKVVSGSVATASPTTGTNLSIVRIA